jgi:membrane-bound metal-dependent hydrolase YbcI (DUF457 family)
MLFRTHVIIALFFVLPFFQQIPNPVAFLPAFLIASVIPDIDTPFSKIGHYKIFRIFNAFTKHRGMIHSFTFLFFISILIFIFFKEILLAFVLGYSLHLILDAFTISGIMPLYPLKFRLRGKIKTGRLIENFIFVLFILIDLLLIFNKISSIF